MAYEQIMGAWEQQWYTTRAKWERGMEMIDAKLWVI
jgi:hypothetical protein